MSRETLSAEAKAVAAAWFGMMPVGSDSHLQFAMVEARPTLTAQRGLDELVASGWISREIDRRGPVTYRPLRDCRPFLNEMMIAVFDETLDPKYSFRLVEPIPDPPRKRSRG